MQFGEGSSNPYNLPFSHSPLLSKDEDEYKALNAVCRTPNAGRL
jgi:hypothetical protein